MNDDRITRYARAIARIDVDHWLDPSSELPDESHELWQAWKETAAAVVKIADEEYQTPAPGDNRAQLPEHLLALLPHRDYLSTACETAADVRTAADKNFDRIEELLGWEGHLHKWCRLNHKFRGHRCICRCHEDQEK